MFTKNAECSRRTPCLAIAFISIRARSQRSQRPNRAMGNARLGRCDRCDLARIEMNAMAKHGVRREHSAFFVNMRVVARAHVKMMHLFQLFAVLGQVGLQIGLQPGSEFGGAAHHFFRASDRKAPTESVLEPSVFGAMPFAAKPLALEERNG